MKPYLILGVLAVFLLLSLLLVGCAQEKKYQATLFAMDTVMELSVWGAEAQPGVEQIEQLLTQLENKWSAQKTDSLIPDLNAGGEALAPQDQIFIDKVEALSRRTNGAFNPRMYAAMQVWGFTDKHYRIPDDRQLQTAMEESLWDLGGAVKGYAGDMAVELLKQMNVQCALLNLGGNFRASGTKQDGTPWTVGIQNPAGEGYVGVVSVEGTTAVVTSGNYQRYFEKDGVRYHHILDPKTGKPAQSGLSSVTVISKSGLTADVFSTALFVMGLEQGSALWRQSDDFEAVFILEDGSIYATQGVKLSGCALEVISRED